MVNRNVSLLLDEYYVKLYIKVTMNKTIGLLKSKSLSNVYNTIFEYYSVTL